MPRFFIEQKVLFCKRISGSRADENSNIAVFGILDKYKILGERKYKNFGSRLFEVMILNLFLRRVTFIIIKNGDMELATRNAF